jgi:hypothetical protein
MSCPARRRQRSPPQSASAHWVGRGSPTAQRHKEPGSSKSLRYFAYRSLCSIAACVVVRAPTIFEESQMPVIDLKLKLNDGYLLIFYAATPQAIESAFTVSARWRFAAIETSKNRLSRDFWRRSIFDFCNSICHFRPHAAQYDLLGDVTKRTGPHPCPCMSASHWKTQVAGRRPVFGLVVDWSNRLDLDQPPRLHQSCLAKRLQREPPKWKRSLTWLVGGKAETHYWSMEMRSLFV